MSDRWPSRAVVQTFALVLPALMAAVGPHAASAADAPIEATIQAVIPEAEAYIAEGMRTFDLPGLAIGIVANDRLVYSEGFGVRGKNGGLPVDARTVFQIGSATKGFLSPRGEQLSAPPTQPQRTAMPNRIPTRAGEQIAAQHHEPPAPAGQIGAEGEIYDPPFFRKTFTRPEGGSGGFGPMASNDFGSDLDIPTVIRNLSD